MRYALSTYPSRLSRLPRSSRLPSYYHYLHSPPCASAPLLLILPLRPPRVLPGSLSPIDLTLQTQFPYPFTTNHLSYSHSTNHTPTPTTTTSSPTTKMSDEGYTSFLEQANQPTSSNKNKPSTQSSSDSNQKTSLSTQTVDTDVPAALSSVKDAYYTSETDEPWEAVSLKWDGGAGGEGKMISDGKWNVSRASPPFSPLLF